MEKTRRFTNLGENKVVVANGLDQSKNGSFGTSAAFNEAVFEVAPVLPPTKFEQPASSKPPRRMASPIPPSLLATADEVIELDLSDGGSCPSHDLQFLCRCLAFVGYFFVLNGLTLIEGA